LRTARVVLRAKGYPLTFLDNELSCKARDEVNLSTRSRKKQKDVLTCSVGPAAGSGLPGLYGQDQTSAKTLIMLLIFQASYSPDKFFPIIHHQLAKEITP